MRLKSRVPDLLRHCATWAVRAPPILDVSPMERGLREGKVERVTGIEPVYSAWKAAVLPLYYTRPARSSERWN